MKALVYHGPGQRGWNTVDDPTIIDPTDIVLAAQEKTREPEALLGAASVG